MTLCGKYTQDYMYNQNRPGFVEDVTKAFWCVFLVHSSNCHSLTKRERKVSQGSVATLIR